MSKSVLSFMRPLVRQMATSTRKFWKDQQGSALAYGIGAASILLVASGSVVDIGRSYLVKSRLSQALDAAALAGGRNLYASTLVADVQAYFNANWETGYQGATANPLTIVPDTNAGTILVSTKASLPTTVIKLIGVKTLSVSATTTVKIQTTGMELVLVMDNTGSMSDNNKMTLMKSAANTMLDIVFGPANDTSPNLYVGLVPFVVSVNVGTGHTSWLDSSYNAANFTPVGWAGCVEARANPYEEESADEPPTGTTKFKPHYWPSNKGVVYKDAQNNALWPSGTANDNEYMNILYASSPTNNKTYGIRQGRTITSDNRGPNLGCHLSAITPLQVSKAVAKAAVADMYSNEDITTGTITSVGAAWGWRVLSPKWRGLWGGATPATLPLDYNSQGMKKVVVLLTDGMNNFYDLSDKAPGCAGFWDNTSSSCTALRRNSNYTAYGRMGDNRFNITNNKNMETSYEAEIDARTKRICAAMKAQGIIVMTVLLQENDNTIQDVFKNCATKLEYYFYAPSSSDLSTVFTTIGHELSNLRIYK